MKDAKSKIRRLIACGVTVIRISQKDANEDIERILKEAGYKYIKEEEGMRVYVRN